METVIDVCNASVEIQGKSILKGINTKLLQSKIYSIIGPNGSRKSTLLKAITSHLKIKDGSIFYAGSDVYKKSAKELAKEMAMLWQKNTAPDDLTVYDLIEYGRFPHRKWGRFADDFSIVEEVIQIVGLEKYKNKKLSQLSGGEAQRAWLGMALAQEPTVLLLDEPTTYLDILHQLDLLELVTVLNQKKKTTIIMVLHDLNQASIYSDRIIVLKDGMVFKEGTPEEIMTDDLLRNVFHVTAERGIDGQTNKPIFHTFKKI